MSNHVATVPMPLAAPPATIAPAPPAAPASKLPLWPDPIEVVGVSGEYQSGKTAWLLSIGFKPEDTLYLDFEKSGKSYAQQLGIKRIDFPALVSAKHPHGYRPLDMFVMWRDFMLGLPLGQWRVIATDPINDIQDGLIAWVSANAHYFGKTLAQYQAMSQIMWADAKGYLKQIMNEIATRCETFAFSTHMRDEYKNKKATGRREAKGVETFYEMASAYFELDRRPDKEGRMPAAPSAIVIKDRIAKLQRTAEGKGEWIMVLPKRMPVCTPDSLRDYMNRPVGLRQATADELLPERGLTDDERLALQVEKANAERDTEALKLERQNRQESATDGKAARMAAAAALQAQANAAGGQAQTSGQAPADAGGQIASQPVQPPALPADLVAVGFSTKEPVSEAQKESMRSLKGMLGLDKVKSAWLQRLAPYNVTSALQLTEAHAAHLIQSLEKDVAARLAEDRKRDSDAAAREAKHNAEIAQAQAQAQATGAPAPTMAPTEPPADPIRLTQLECIAGYKAILKIAGGAWKARLAPYGVDSAKLLNATQGDELIKWLKSQREGGASATVAANEPQPVGAKR